MLPSLTLLSFFFLLLPLLIYPLFFSLENLSFLLYPLTLGRLRSVGTAWRGKKRRGKRKGGKGQNISSIVSLFPLVVLLVLVLVLVLLLLLSRTATR